LKLVCPYLNSLIEIKDGEVFSLTIENQQLFREIVEDMHYQQNGEKGNIVVSENNTPVPFSKRVEIFESFAPFDLNSKSLISKAVSRLEKTANDAEHYLETSRILADIENYITALCFSMPFDVECGRLNAGALIKSVAISFINDYSTQLEAVVDCMNIITTLDSEKLFVTINIRSYFPDSEMELFVKTIGDNGFKVLMLESSARKIIPGTKRLLIDSDLCEI